MIDAVHWAGSTEKRTRWDLFRGDASTVLKGLNENSFNCAVTSPPYFWLRDYGVEGQLGHEESVSEYVTAITSVMDGVRRVLRKDGVLFLNLGDTYYSGKGASHGQDKKSSRRRFGLRAVDKSGGLGIGIKPKSMIGIHWRVAIQMVANNWTLRSAIVWHRKHALSEAVKDRPRRSYENVFMFTKDRNYYFNREALKDIKLAEDVWTIPAKPKRQGEIDTAAFPDELVRRCLELGCPKNGSVLDPFAGSGTTLRVALASSRSATGIELNPEYCDFIVRKLEAIK